MGAASDVGRVAAELLQQQWHGHRVVELEGPRRVSPNDIAASFARLLNRSVRATIVPRNTWEALFRSQGMKNPTPRIRMLDGFNEGWIAFEREHATVMLNSTRCYALSSIDVERDVTGLASIPLSAA